MSRSKKLTALLCVTALVCFAALVLQRYRTGLNYLPVHVSLGQDEPEGAFRVFCQSPFGSIGELTVDPRYRSRWKQWPSLSAVKRLFVSGATPEELAKRKLAVWMGESSKTGAELTVSVLPAVTRLADLDGIAVVELKVEPNAPSQLRWARDSVNWQGDFCLVGIPFLQTVVLVLLLVCGGILIAPTFFPKKVGSHKVSCFNGSGAPKITQAIAGGGVWFLAVLIFGHHFYLNALTFFDSRIADQYFWGSMILVLFVLCLTGLVAVVRNMQEDRSCNRAAYLIIAVIFLAKIAWIMSMDSVQPMDYGEYWKHGVAIASGDISAVHQDANPYKSAYVSRAFLYAFPVAKIFGGSNTGLEFANLISQLASTILFWSLTRSIFGARRACLSLPFFLVYPDLWYSATLMTHETPGMFWLLVVLWLQFHFASLIRRAHLSHDGLLVFVKLMCLAIATGAAVGMLDLQRSQGPFVVGGILLFGVASVLGSASTDNIRVQPRKLVLVAVACFVGLVTEFALKNYVVENVRAVTGPAAELSTMAALTAVDSMADGYPTNAVTWRFLYFDQIPTTNRIGFSFRKLIYEKFGVGLQFWQHVYGKDEVFAQNNWVMQWCFAGFGTIPGDSGSASWDIPNRSRKEFVCSAIYVCLCGLSLLRLWRLDWFPMASYELFPICVFLAGGLILLLLTDALAPYDIFLSIPLSWNAGIVCSGVNPRDAGVVNSALWRRFRWGIIGLSVLVSVQLGLGRIVNHLGFTFYDLTEMAPCMNSDSEVKPNRSALVTPVCMSLSYDDSPEKMVYAGDRFSMALCIPLNAIRGNELRFFLSGNQRAMKVPVGTELHWEQIPVSYTLTMDGIVLAAGPIADLETPRFIESFVDKSVRRDEAVHLTLHLDASEEFATDSAKYVPSIALEYLH